MLAYEAIIGIGNELLSKVGKKFVIPAKIIGKSLI